MRLAPGERRACHACGTMIVGAKSSNSDNVQPIVLEPREGGNVLLQQKDGVLTAFVFGKAEIREALAAAGVVMRVNHFADCPDAARFER